MNAKRFVSANDVGHLTTRRDFLRASGCGMAHLGLIDLLTREAQASPRASSDRRQAPMLPQPAHFRPRAERVIHIFLNGGVSHVDTFDPKPELTRRDGQRLPSPNLLTERQTGVAMASPFRFMRHGDSGLPISEIFQDLGQHADDLCVIRSLYADFPNHEPSLMLMNCGVANLIRPSMGSWLTYGLGSENQNLPGFVAMCPGGYPIKGPQNWQSAFLPSVYQGTFVNTERTDVDSLLDHLKNPRLTREEQRRSLNLVQDLNRMHAANHGMPDRLEGRIQSFEQAYRMQFAATEAFDLRQESQYVRDMYGDSVQAQQLLIARRLAERGVRFVQLWHGAGQPWDNHENIEQNHRRLAGQCSQAIAALLTDLKQRGLLDTTLVILGGEFGRTPTVELDNSGTKAKAGRDHNHYGFSVVLAGGGVRGGTAYGATDEFGFAAMENRTHVHDLHATILHLMGLDHTQLVYRHAGRDFRLTDVHGNVIHDVIA